MRRYTVQHDLSNLQRFARRKPGEAHTSAPWSAFGRIHKKEAQARAAAIVAKSRTGIHLVQRCAQKKKSTLQDAD